jgi:hypothetical protein
LVSFPAPPWTGRRSFPKGKPGNLPEMDGGIEQNPAYGTARALGYRVFANRRSI